MTSENSVIVGTALDVPVIIAKLWEAKVHLEGTNERTKNVRSLVSLLLSGLDDKSTYEDIENFLPQISHLTIHAAKSTYKEMENLVCTISKFSMNASIQLTYSMLAALEDFQPEDSAGRRNPNCNNLLFQRCSRLLQLIERCVIEKDFDCSDEELSLVSKVGWLNYKRITRRTACSRKGWKRRYFSILNGVLMCYTDDSYGTLKRAMPLSGCTVQAIKNEKYGSYFEIFCPSTNIKYQLHADDDLQVIPPRESNIFYLELSV